VSSSAVTSGVWFCSVMVPHLLGCRVGLNICG
jgi:hypothetical protein